MMPAIGVTARSLLSSVRLACAASLLCVSSVFAQQRGSIEGYVRDANSGTPLAQARIQLQGANREVKVDRSGRFRLADVPAGVMIVRVEAPGYAASVETIAVYAGPASVVNFQLTPLTEIMEGLLVQADRGEPGDRSRGESMSRVRSDANHSVATNATDLLAGKVPGAIITGSGMAGGSSRILLRGISTVTQSTDPAIYIDGIRVNYQMAPAGNQGGTMVLDQLDPASIDRIEVLRGPSAGSMYGHEASNGVILIWTKRGGGGDTPR